MKIEKATYRKSDKLKTFSKREIGMLQTCAEICVPYD